MRKLLFYSLIALSTPLLQSCGDLDTSSGNNNYKKAKGLYDSDFEPHTLDEQGNKVAYEIDGVINKVIIVHDSNYISKNESIYIGGSFSGGILKMAYNGEVDQDFLENIGNAFNNEVLAMTLDNDKNLYVGGKFDEFNDSDVGHLIKIKKTGLIDSTFDPDVSSDVTALYFDSNNGLIYLGGTFTDRLAALDEDANVTSFNDNLGSGLNGTPYVINQDSDGNIWVGGAFTTFNGSTHNRLVVLDSNGLENSTITLNLESAGFNGSVLDIAIFSTSVLIGGTFDFYGSSPQEHLKLLSTDGANANTDFSSTTNSDVYSILALPSEQVLISGDFDESDSIESNGIFRASNEGDLDTSFSENIAEGFDSFAPVVKDSDYFSNGKIIAVGSFTSFQGNSVSRIVRIK